MNWLQYLNPSTIYWRRFLKRFEKIPPEYQSIILDEYEEAEKQGRDLDAKKMWATLREGENKLKRQAL